MNGETIMMVAEKALGEDELPEVSRLLKQGMVEEAKEHVLQGVDDCYMVWLLSFLEAAGYYNLLDLSPERAGQFPQR